MFLQSIFTDSKSLSNFIIVAVLVDLLGDLEFAGGEMVVGFQMIEGLLKIVGLGLFVGDLVEDGV